MPKVFLGLMVALLWSCSQSPKLEPVPFAEPPPPPSVVEKNLIAPEIVANQDVAHESYLQAIKLKQQDQVVLAEPWLRNAVAHAPESQFLAFELVSLLVDLDKNADALQVASTAIRKIAEPNVEELYLTGHLYRVNNHADSCRYYLKKVVELQPNHLRALLEYSVVLELQQDYLELANVYQKMLPLLDYPNALVIKYIEILRQDKVHGDSLAVVALMERMQVQSTLENAKPLVSILLNMDSTQQVRQVLLQLERNANNGEDEFRYLTETWGRLNDYESALRSQILLSHLDSLNAVEKRKVVELRLQLGQLDQAQEDLKEYAKLDSGSMVDHMQGVIWEYRKNTKEALEAYSRAIEKAPLRWKHYDAIIDLLSNDKKWTDAQIVVDSAIAKMPNQLPPMERKALLYFLEGYNNSLEGKDAQDLFMKAYQLQKGVFAQDSSREQGIFTYAIILERMDSLPRMQQLLERLLQGGSPTPDMLNYYGYLLINRKLDIRRGLSLVERALQHYPQNTAFLDSKGWGLAMLGNWDEARSIFQHVMKNGGLENWEALEHAALVEEHFGNKAYALELWKKLLAISPDYSTAKEHIKLLETP